MPLIVLSGCSVEASGYTELGAVYLPAIYAGKEYLMSACDTRRINVTRSYRLIPGRIVLVVRTIGSRNGDFREQSMFFQRSRQRGMTKAHRSKVRAKYAVRRFYA